MGKHIIEEEALMNNGFNLVKIEDASQISADISGRVLQIIGDGTVDINIQENKLKLSTKAPIFKTLDWQRGEKHDN